MKKLLSVLLVVSMVLAPINSRISFADETASNENEQSWSQKLEKLWNMTKSGSIKATEVAKDFSGKALNETKKAGHALWISATEFAKLASEGAAYLYVLAAENPQFSIPVVLGGTAVTAAGIILYLISKNRKPIAKNNKWTEENALKVQLLNELLKSIMNARMAAITYDEGFVERQEALQRSLVGIFPSE